jgi:hypothetical protein
MYRIQPLTRGLYFVRNNIPPPPQNDAPFPPLFSLIWPLFYPFTSNFPKSVLFCFFQISLEYFFPFPYFPEMHRLLFTPLGEGVSSKMVPQEGSGTLFLQQAQERSATARMGQGLLYFTVHKKLIKRDLVSAAGSSPVYVKH